MTSHRVRNWRTGGPDGVIAGDSTVSPLIVDNVKEELDAGGEYYFDAAVHELSLIPNGTDAAPPTRVVAAHLETLISIKGTQAAPVHVSSAALPCIPPTVRRALPYDAL